MNDGGEIAFVRDPCSLTSLPFAGEDEIGCDDRTAGTPAVPAPQVRLLLSRTKTAVFAASET